MSWFKRKNNLVSVNTSHGEKFMHKKDALHISDIIRRRNWRKSTFSLGTAFRILWKIIGWLIWIAVISLIIFVIYKVISYIPGAEYLLKKAFWSIWITIRDFVIGIFK